MTDSEKPVVLNVDDMDAQRYVKTRDLDAGGFAVIEARSGADALQIIEARQPHIVLLDVQLPDISGFEVCTYIKKKWPHIMVLQTSATFTTSQSRTAGLDAGADAYLVQPAEPLELAATINALLRLRRAEDALRGLNATLEQRVQDRTSQLAATNAKLMAEIAQRQKAEAALVQAQKMEAVGQLTGGLAHDFNNLLTAVLGNLELIRARATEPRIVRWAENAGKAAERGSKLTAQLLAFSRTQKLTTTAVDVNALIEGMRELLAQSLGANVTCEMRLAPGLPAATADFNQLELAILNLAINARDAMPDGGTLTISTALGSGVPPAVLISVADTGTGMPPEVVKRAFDPFFTTKPLGKGTGLGLSQVYGIVQQCGGNVEIHTEQGKGTTICMSLPLSSSDAPAESSRLGVTQLGHSEKILVLDDDADVREFLSGVLKELGYLVRESAHAEDAYETLQAFQPDLLIVDFAMPGMNGAEFVRLARQRRPDLHALFVSGFSDSNALAQAVGQAPLLRKPFKAIDLAAAVRSALDG
jgi:signal transduction histidine kinase